MKRRISEVFYTLVDVLEIPGISCWATSCWTLSISAASCAAVLPPKMASISSRERSLVSSHISMLDQCSITLYHPYTYQAQLAK